MSPVVSVRLKKTFFNYTAFFNTGISCANNKLKNNELINLGRNMELIEEAEIHRRCYKCEHELFDNLNITYNASNSMFVLWNRYQIFVYEDLNFVNTSKIFVPEFQIHQLIMSNNYLMCLDTSGNVHITSLKFKNPAQKRFKSSFQPKEQNIMVCQQLEDCTLSLKHHCNTYYLYYNKINGEFQLENKVALKYKGRWPLASPAQNKCLLTSQKLPEEEFTSACKIFNIQEQTVLSDYSLVVMSVDKLTVLTCLFSPKMSEEEITLEKLHTCPSEISNIEIIKLERLYILIGLTIGTILRLSFSNISNKPEIVHLNTAIYKFMPMKDSIIYTDGRSMWKADKTFDQDVTFVQFFMRQVKDFIKFGDQIICTSFTNLIYIFPIDDDFSYIEREPTEEYCAAEKLLNNSEYLYKIIEEVEKNKILAKRINEEGNYITAISLSKRQDIMDNVIKYGVTVFDNYEDVLKENLEITLTENMHEYFKHNSFFFLIKLSASTLQHMFNNILSNMYNDVKIHVTISTATKLLKTTSIRISEAFKKLNALIPIDIKNELFSEIKVEVKLVTSIPGAFDERQKLWVTLYRKSVILKSEHFIKAYSPLRKCLKVPVEPIDDLIFNTALIQHGNLFKITDVSKFSTDGIEFSMYVKLPNNYKEIFKRETKHECMRRLNTRKAAFIQKQCTSDDFLKANSNICFEVGKVKVQLEIQFDDFTSPILKVSSPNISATFHLRTFFSELLYNDIDMNGPGKVFIKYTMYNTAENLQKEIKKCVLNKSNYEDFQLFAEQFERNVIGGLPL